MVTRLKQPHVSSSSTETSSESKNSLNGDNGRKDTTERRLAKPKTNSGTSLISQRSIQPSFTAPPMRPNGIRRDMSNDTLAHSSANDEDEGQDTPPQSDVAREASASNSKDIWASVPRPTVKAHYKLHNPLGPRWYRNHHLIPPSHFKPSMRPPTFFSSSFPPIGTASHDYPDEEEDLGRSPSHSPLPTPESSQTRVQDGSKPRSRKTSQTAPDAIDMLDLSDPWGQNWHHQSPYEFGQTTTVASLDTTDLPNRTRRASFSVAHARQRSVAPSPLSQSTSAVNLPSLQPEIKPPRKLNKRKTTNVTTTCQDPPPQVNRKALSAPTTPIDAPTLPSAQVASDIPPNFSASPAGPFISAPSPTLKREKRGSLLNRLVKKFSTLKRGSEPILGGIEGWNYEASSMSIHRRETTSATGNTYAFPEKHDSAGDPPEDDKPVLPRQEDDRASLSSLEIPYSVMGKLTVVNPDPCEDNEPIAAENPSQIHLDIEDSPNLPHHGIDVPPSPERPEPSSDDPPPEGEPDTNFDKPLPPRLGTPKFSRLVMSEIMVSTPQLMEQPLPPLPPKEEPPVCEATRSPSPGHPPEQPESPRLSTFDPFHIVNSISLDHTAHAPPPTPTAVEIQVTPESPPKAPSLRQSPSPPAVPDKPVVEQRQTQSPPAPTTVQRDLGRQPSNRNASPSPEVTLTSERRTGGLRSANGHTLHSARELPAEFKYSPSHTRSRSNSRPDSRNVPAPVQIHSQVRVPFPASIEESHVDSPVSTSSMLANPPTPFDHRLSINISDRSSTPPTVPSKSVRHRSPPLPRTTGTIKRQTETFRLVRSSSGNVYASSQTILAQGQQWEVVESVETTKKDRSLGVKVDGKRFKDQGRERESDRERERDRERELERERQRAREKDLEREKQRAREREIELQKERAREERENREAERIQRELDIQREKERAKERERRDEERLQRELEIQREKERAKERERVQKELELQREWERTREWERREVEREKERQREREKEKEREREHVRQKERQTDRQREKDRERAHREKERRDEKERERTREIEKERVRRKERERREREKERERGRRREREREKEREREERERWERERERQRRAHERSFGEDPERRSGHNDHKSRDYDRKSREYEPRNRDYEPRTDGSEHRSPRTRDADRRPTGYDQSSKREPRTLEKPRHYEDSRPHDNHSHSRKYDEHHDHKSTRHPMEMPASHSQPDPIIQHVPISEPRLERMPSVSARPISQLPSADEMNAVRAKEQWEMERLWKARSLHGLEPNGTAIHVIPGHSSTSSMSDDIPEIIPGSPPQVHGSSHTAYLVPTPFHDSRSQLYRSMPTALPPIYYHSPASIPSIPDSLSSYEPYETLRFYPGPAQVAEPLLPPSFPPKSNNPLPEPPRESSYKPTPLPPISPSKRRSTEYWTYNGITTAH